MAELTVPSKKRRALADALMNVQGPQPQMVGNQMVYNPWAGLASGIAQGLGGYLKGKEMRAADDVEQSRRDELARLLGGNQVSGGAPQEPGGAPPSPSQAVRPASSADFKAAITARLLAGDDEGAAQYVNYAKVFGEDAPEYGAAENYYDPVTKTVFGGMAAKDASGVKRLPYPIYKAPTSSYDPVSGSLIQTGGLPLDMVGGPPSPQAPQPAAQGAAPPPTANSRVIDISGGKETPQARKLREEAEARRRQEQREERRLAIAEREAGEKDAERAKKVKGAQVNYETGDRMLTELESLIKTTDPKRLIDPRTKEGARAKSLSTQLGDIYRSKEFADLGVINPADVPRIEAVVADPTSWRGFLQGRDSQLERIKTMREMLNGRRSLIYGEAAPAAPAPGKTSRLGRREL